MTISFARHQFPPAIIRHAVWLYVRFTLSYHDFEDLLAERGLDVSYETVRPWVLKFGPIRNGIARPTPTANVAMASRRDGRDDCGAAVLAVACGDDEGEVHDLLVQQPKAPARIVLGAWGFDQVSRILETRLEEVRRQKDLSLSADFPKKLRNPPTYEGCSMNRSVTSAAMP